MRSLHKVALCTCTLDEILQDLRHRWRLDARPTAWRLDASDQAQIVVLVTCDTAMWATGVNFYIALWMNLGAATG